MDAEYQQAREQLAEILNRKEYTGGDWLERGIRFIEDLWEEGLTEIPSLSLSAGSIPVWLLPGVLFLLLVLSLWWVRKNLASDRRLKGKSEHASREHPKNEIELRTLGEEAAHRGDFRLAIRCQFQAVLSALRVRGILSDVSHRTHREQIAEIRSRAPQQGPLFESLVFRFEEVWYGQMPVGPAEYQQFRRQADKLMKGDPAHATTG